jgi:hypothetical protein
MKKLIKWIVFLIIYTAMLVVFCLLLCGCTMHHYVHQETICDTLEVEVIDTLVKWEPAIVIPDSAKIYGELRRVWVQHQDGTWHEYLLKH